MLAPFIVAAQDIDSIDEAFSKKYNLRQVVISATRPPKALTDVPVPTRVITAGEIEQADAANVQGVLEQTMPGLSSPTPSANSRCSTCKASVATVCFSSSMASGRLARR